MVEVSIKNIEMYPCELIFNAESSYLVETMNDLSLPMKDKTITLKGGDCLKFLLLRGDFVGDGAGDGVQRKLALIV